MKVTVVRGTVVYKGKEYPLGSSFECDKATSGNLVIANVVEVVEVVEEKKATKKVVKPKEEKED